ARAAESPDAVAVGPVDGAKDVRAVARATDGDEQVARARQVLELLHEDAVEALVVGPGQDVRCVVGQAEDAEAFFLIVVVIFAGEGAFAEVFAEVRGVGTRAAVADDEDESALLIAIVDRVGESADLGGIDARQFLAYALEELADVELDTEHAILLRDPWPFHD